jgi:predicted metalloprotease with PDZ domain
VLGAVLDMEVRGRTRNAQSLDDVMRYLYQNYAARDVGVPENGLQEALEKITKGTFQPFFDDHVYGTKPIDYDRYFYYVGYTLDESKDDSRPEAQFGVGLTPQNNGLASIVSLDPDGAAFAAGMDIGDVFVALDGKKVTNGDFLDMMKDYKVGQTVHVTAFRNDEITTFDVTLKGGGNRTYEFHRMDNTSTLQNQTRRDWLGLAAG